MKVTVVIGNETRILQTSLDFEIELSPIEVWVLTGGIGILGLGFAGCMAVWLYGIVVWLYGCCMAGCWFAGCMQAPQPKMTRNMVPKNSAITSFKSFLMFFTS